MGHQQDLYTNSSTTPTGHVISIVPPVVEADTGDTVLHVTRKKKQLETGTKTKADIPLFVVDSNINNDNTAITTAVEVDSTFDEHDDNTSSDTDAPINNSTHNDADGENGPIQSLNEVQSEPKDINSSADVTPDPVSTPSGRNQRQLRSNKKETIVTPSPSAKIFTGGNNKFFCDTCDEKFQTKRRLNLHMKLHSMELIPKRKRKPYEKKEEPKAKKPRMVYNNFNTVFISFRSLHNFLYLHIRGISGPSRGHTIQ